MLSRRLWLAGLILCGVWGCAKTAPPAPAGGGGATGGTPATETQTPDATETPTARGTIGVSLLTFENPFFKVIADHIESEGKKHGYETIALSADQDPAKQSDQVNDFVVKKVSAIVLSPCESRSIVPAIQAANKAGIPVFTVDIPCLEPGVQIVSQIVTDNLGGGRAAANAIIEVLGEAGGQVAILEYAQAESCRLRVKGFLEVIESHNKEAQNKIEVVGNYEGGGDREKSASTMKDVLQSKPDLKAVFCINDPSALGARATLEQAGKADVVTIVGFDGQTEAKQAIKEGKIYADPIQFPDRMGIEAVNSIVAHLKGKDVQAENLIPTKLYKKADADADPSLK